MTACDNIPYDPMLQAFYKGLDQHIFTIDKQPDPIIYIDDIRAYNVKEGLALNPDEIAYLEGLAEKLGRKFDRFRSIRFFAGQFGTLPS